MLGKRNPPGDGGATCIAGTFVSLAGFGDSAVPDAGATLFASLPGTPLSRDQLTLLKAGNTASGGYPGLADLGITARPLALFLDRWMTRYRKAGRFGKKSLA